MPLTWGLTLPCLAPMTTAPTALRARTNTLSFAFLALGVLVAASRGSGLLGPVAQSSVELFGLLTLVAVPLGIRLHRPIRRAAWWSTAFALLLFLVELGLRSPAARLGGGHGEPLYPLLVALAAYLTMAVSLTMLASSPDLDDVGKLDIVLDGLIAMLAAFSVAWTYLIKPVLSHHGLPLPNRVIEASFPPLDVYLVMIAFRIGFDRRSRRATSGRLLLVSVLLMLVGDIAYTLADVVRVVRIPLRLTDVPYLLAATTFGAAALHPSMRQLALPRRRHLLAPRTLPTSGRLVLVAAALVFPSVVVATDRSSSLSSRLVLGAVAVLTAAVATWRLFRALRTSASSEVRLAHQATHDQLTGLPNRTLAGQWITGLLEDPGLAGDGVAVFFLDLDRFKLVNDTFGHSHGDLLLTEVAARLKSAIGPRGLVARVGGDEFVIVLDHVPTMEAARREAERVQGCFEAAFSLGEAEVFATASLGVAMRSAGEPLLGPERLIRDADMAMYQAKEAGRDTICLYDSSMHERIVDRLSFERDLRLAIERDEFHLVYQPIVALSEGAPRVIGLEALLRWEGPARGLVPPALFIGVAEDSGLINEIGDWVLHEACARLAAWRAEPGLGHLHVSVNMSALQLKRESLFTRIRGVLAHNGLPSEALCIELTESLLMESPADGSALLLRLKELGVRLALDDFGTGYSSLAYLKQFPVDYVKVDKSFVDGLTRQDSSDETLVAAVVSMARAIGAVTVAEGVEVPEQEARLRAIGVEGAQGYLYSRPVPAGQVVDTVRRLTPNRGLRLVNGGAGPEHA